MPWKPGGGFPLVDGIPCGPVWSQGTGGPVWPSDQGGRIAQAVVRWAGELGGVHVEQLS